MRASALTPRAVVLIALALSGCALQHAWVAPGAVPTVAPAADLIDTTLLLVGDAGELVPGTPDGVLETLQTEAALAPQRTLVLFLGDNVYPDGLPEPGAKERAHAEAVLALQAQVVQRSGARGIFLPGNHDHHLDGRRNVRREAAFIDAAEPERLEYRPRGDCAGPDVVDLGAQVRLVLFDSTWWLHDEFSNSQDPSCTTRTQSELIAALETALTTAGERVVVVASHHPLASHGWHGGFFTWRDHLFPLSRSVGWLWLPLPGLGSLYPVYRKAGGYGQDIASGAYQKMLAGLEMAFREHPPLVYVAGHEHSLQVLTHHIGVPWALVSGAGSTTRPDPVSRGEDTRAVSPNPGFLRLDVLHDGRARLELVELTQGGAVQRPWSAWLNSSAP